MMMTSAEQCMSNENKIKWFKIKKNRTIYQKEKKDLKTPKNETLFKCVLIIPFFLKEKEEIFVFFFPFALHSSHTLST